GAMRGLDLVGVDHQHRLAVDLGLVGQQQVLVRQVGVAAVGTGTDGDAAVEDRATAVGGDPAPGQVACGVAGDVLDPQAGVDVATPAAQLHAVGDEHRALA